MFGSFSRDFAMLSTGTEMRSPVPGPRLDWRMSGRPGSSSSCRRPLLLGRPISGNSEPMVRPPRSNTRKLSPGEVTSQAGSGSSCSRMPRRRIGSVTGSGERSSAGWPSRV
jgi:hypothetical protein